MPSSRLTVVRVVDADGGPSKVMILDDTALGELAASRTPFSVVDSYQVDGCSPAGLLALARTFEDPVSSGVVSFDDDSCSPKGFGILFVDPAKRYDSALVGYAAELDRPARPLGAAQARVQAAYHVGSHNRYAVDHLTIELNKLGDAVANAATARAIKDHDDREPTQ